MVCGLSQDLSLLFFLAASFDGHIGARSIDMWTRYCTTTTHTHTHRHTLQYLKARQVDYSPVIGSSVRETHANKARDTHTAVHVQQSHTHTQSCHMFYIYIFIY